MIEHFDKIENLGVFANYKKPTGMEPFQRFNLIYGLNGSGKTTLSRFFADLNSGKADGFENLKYKITTDDGVFQQGKPYTRNIRVFNAEYVEANIGQLEGQLSPIYVIGEESKTLAKVVKADEKAHSSLETKRDEKDEELKKLEAKRGKLFTDIARQITESAKGTTTRTYNKRNAETAYASLSTPQVLDVQDLADASKEMNQSAMDMHAEYTDQTVYIGGTDEPLFAALIHHEENIRKIVQKSATSIAIERLKTNSKIAAWVESGREIHALKDDGTCEYCQQEIPKSRESELAAHFNKSDHNLKQEIESALEDTNGFIETVAQVKGLDDKLFYPEFRDEHSGHEKALSEEQTKLITHLEHLRKLLQEKLTRRTEGYVASIAKFDSTAWGNAISSLNSVIKQHNSETDAFDKRLENNFAKIESHFLSTIDTDVKEKDLEILSTKSVIEICTEGDPKNGKLGITALDMRIKANRALISNSHQAAVELSEKLASFLGRDDIKFEAEGEGYRIMRFGRAAKRLSEGEKTAITFLYFVVGLQDQDFDIGEGVVVIDDPISSLDSSSVYQAFSFLKNAVKDARQVFLFTHNFEFLKLLVNWFQNIPPRKTGKTYWMLHCATSSATQRETIIKPLDNVLLENKSEFAYLLKVLIEFQSDGTIANSYPIPNIVRKVLEAFLAQHSTGNNFYKLLHNLDYDETKKSSLYKYTNDLSHPTLSGLDPALVGETQNNIKHMLEMIQKVAPIHYKALTDTIQA